MAGHISELLKDGTKWEQLLRTHLLEPLGMDSTITNDAVLDWSAIALPYVLHNGNLHQVDKELVKYVCFPDAFFGRFVSVSKEQGILVSTQPVPLPRQERCRKIFKKSSREWNCMKDSRFCETISYSSEKKSRHKGDRLWLYQARCWHVSHIFGCIE